MAVQRLMTRDEMIADFWARVRDLLINQYHRHPDQADFGIGRYRYETERLKIGDVVYNGGVEYTAEVINDHIEDHLDAAKEATKEAV